MNSKRMLFFVLGMILSACQANGTPVQSAQPTGVAPSPSSQAIETPTTAAVTTPAGGETMKISSPDFEYGKKIGVKYTCDSGDKGESPELNISGVPAAARSLALIVEDPDAFPGPFYHWVLYNIPPTLNDVPESMIIDSHVPGIGTQGKNSFDNVGYGGPCPPLGMVHHYYFRLYALDLELNIQPDLYASDILKKMDGHVLAQAEWMGMYK